jgi:hypothetical protein
MGCWFNWECDSCEYEFTTEGPWEFYRDERGRRRDYGHPSPASPEAEQRGIYGFWGKLYCPDCDAVKNVIIVEFREPCRGALGAWFGGSEPRPEYASGDRPVCPKCKGKRLMMDMALDETFPCPRCRKGRIRGSMGPVS